MTAQLDSTVQEAIDRGGASYDDLPYVSHPFAQTHPGRIAAIARIFKLAAPALTHARVLELGCAAGGNLIPLAARFPDAHFLGVDLSQRQIDDGARRIATLGLKNIELRRQSITDVGAADGSFDYVICHGVYSWVPAPVRDAILKIARENLSPDGVAFISYNVLPGWRLRQTLRDALILHVGSQGALRERVARAREMLSFLEQHTPEATTWGRIFRAEAAQLRNMDDSYIGHEFLEDCNEPCSFAEFMSDATGHSLAYLGEADLAMMLPENVNAPAAPLLRALAGDNQVQLEQHMDIFTGRLFRQTLLIRKEREEQCVRSLTPKTMEGLHFLAHPSFALTREEADKAVFGDSSGTWFSTSDAGVRAALQALVARLPGSSSVDELIGSVGEEHVLMAGDLRSNVEDALFRMSLVGLLRPSTEPTAVAARLTAKPVACPFLRSDAAAGVVYSANLRHESIMLDVVAQVVTPLLDGSNDRQALIEAVIAAQKQGRIFFWRDNVLVTDESDVAECAATHVDRILDYLLRNACLVTSAQ